MIERQYLTFLLLTTAALVQLIANTSAAPPTTWKEHWFEHNQDLTRVFLDQNVAVYFDKDVDHNIKWPNTYLAKLWAYVKRRYGSFGPESQLYAIFHTRKYSGGHPSTYFDASHDKRNVIDVGSNDAIAWTSGKGGDLSITTHEVAHVVEFAAKGIKNSPAFPVWGDSKWAEIFIYDVYSEFNMQEEKTGWYDEKINTADTFPRKDTYWFRDWFYPIYKQYGGGNVLNNFFTVLAAHYAKTGTGSSQAYDGSMNMGEFVHFWSGASGKNLKDMATKAFGWTTQYQKEFEDAKKKYPNVKYA